MRILVTNDDGINADGLSVAESIAREVAGPDGEVVVMAPARDRSGSSRAITYTRPLSLEEVGPGRFAVHGTPADCVILASHVLANDGAFDLVLSGVNRGHNLGRDTVISGTIGAALQAAQSGIPGVAMSQSYGGRLDRRDPETPWRLSRARGGELLQGALAAIKANLAACLSINFPALLPGEERGIRLSRLGQRENCGIRPVKRTESANGVRREFDLTYHPPAVNDSLSEDRRLVREGWITVTPIQDDLTAGICLTSALLERLQGVSGP